MTVGSSWPRIGCHDLKFTFSNFVPFSCSIASSGSVYAAPLHAPDGRAPNQSGAARPSLFQAVGEGRSVQFCVSRGISMPAIERIERRDAIKSVATVGYAKEPTLIPSATSGGWSGNLAKFVFPGKPVQALVCYTLAPERTVSGWVHDGRDMPLRAYIALLRSKHGARVLEYTMRGCKEKWWHDRENEQFELPL